MEFGIDILGLRFLTGDLGLMKPYEAYYDWSLVLASYACAAFGSFAGLTISQHIAISKKVLEKTLWLVAGSCAMGAAVWSMHFVAMLAYKLPFEVSFVIRLTAISILPAIVASFVALLIMSNPRATEYHRLVGGVFMGAGIGAMHFTGMEAMRANASMGYDPLLFAMSIVVAVALAYTAITARSKIGKLRIRGNLIRSNLIAAAIMGFAISGMHYTAMTAVTFYEGSLCAAYAGEVVDGDFLADLELNFILAFAAIVLVGFYARKNAARSALFSSIFENSVDALVVANRRGLVTQFSPSAERIFGYKADEIVGRDVSLLLPPSKRDWHRERVKTYDPSRDTEIIGQNREVTAIRKNGQEFPAEVVIVEIPVGRESLFTAAVRDITQRREMQEAQETAFKEIANSLKQQRELNETQRQFVAMASHEFRTPLTVIDLAAQRIARSMGQEIPERAGKGIEEIRKSVRNMTELIESILSAARMDAGKIAVEIADCDIGELIEQTCERHQEISQQHKIVCKVGGLPPAILADASAIRQVLVNLLSNAVKYSGQGTEVRVEARCDAGDIVLSVADQGLGIPEDELPKMFNRFFRASTSTGIAGTGIGLHLTKTLVEMHGGSISVASKKGVGSIFTVRLPVAGPRHAETPVAIPA